MKINVVGIIKGVAELAVSAGVGVVVGNVVKATTPYDLNKFNKIMVAVGGYGLGAVLGDLSAKHISSQIDGYAARLEEIIHPSADVQEALEEVQEQAAALGDGVADAAQAIVSDIKKVKKDQKSDETE